MVIRYVCNAQLQPPAPFVHVLLRNPLTGAEVFDVPAQLDTAADRSLLPMSVVQTLTLPAVGSIPIGGVGGTIGLMTLYAVLLGVSRMPLRLIEVVAHPDEPWVLLGRNVLNTHRSLLDCPQLSLEIS